MGTARPPSLRRVSPPRRRTLLFGQIRAPSRRGKPAGVRKHCIGRGQVPDAVSRARPSAISRAGRRGVARAELCGPHAASSLAPIHSAAPSFQSRPRLLLADVADDVLQSPSCERLPTDHGHSRFHESCRGDSYAVPTQARAPASAFGRRHEYPAHSLSRSKTGSGDWLAEGFCASSPAGQGVNEQRWMPALPMARGDVRHRHARDGGGS